MTLSLKRFFNILVFISLIALWNLPIAEANCNNNNPTCDSCCSGSCPSFESCTIRYDSYNDWYCGCTGSSGGAIAGIVISVIIFIIIISIIICVCNGCCRATGVRYSQPPAVQMQQMQTVVGPNGQHMMPVYPAQAVTAAPYNPHQGYRLDNSAPPPIYDAIPVHAAPAYSPTSENHFPDVVKPQPTVATLSRDAHEAKGNRSYNSNEDDQAGVREEAILVEDQNSPRSPKETYHN